MNNKLVVRIKDFPAHSLLLEVAKMDTTIACRLAEEFGGTSQYIHQLDSIAHSVRNRQIINRSNKLVSHYRIAKELGLSSGWVRQIIRKMRPPLSLKEKATFIELF
jgi:Mor family transcriptional regulator